MSYSTGNYSKRRFVGPTRGLGLRPKTNGLIGNIENYGGKCLIKAEMENHKLRMQKVRPVINLNPPWSHQQQMGLQRPSSSASSRVNKLRNDTAATRTYPADQTANSNRPATASPSHVRGGGHIHHQQQQQQQAGDGTGHQEFNLSVLSEDQRTTYREMLSLLCSLDNAGARAILEQLYRESEDHRLLVDYTGVFPTLERETDMEGRSKNTRDEQQ